MSRLEPFQCLVDGNLISGRQQQVLNPATGQAFATYHVADDRMVDIAVRSAAAAFERWRNVTISERRALLMRLADVTRDNAAHLARLLTLEQGKPLAESALEISFAESLFRHYATIHENAREVLFTEACEGFVRTYTPLGIVAGIIPWNVPFGILAMKVAPALLTGNPIIVKPAPTTPLTTLEFGRLCATLVPPGLLQVLGDDGSVGPMLTVHPGIRLVSFTGSTVSGRKVVATSSSTLKRLNLELGGNDPAVVLRDADLATTVPGIFRAAFRNCGQICGAVKRVYVHADIYAAFCDALGKLVNEAVVGDGHQSGVTHGPLQNRAQYEKATAMLADARRSGRILAQSAAPSGRGYFVPLTLLGDLDDEHALIKEEQFAPLLPVQKFIDEEDVIARANGTPYGLTASVWSADIGRAEALVQQIDAGLLCVNAHNRGSLHLGISMAKASGSGWMFGDEAMKEFMQPHLLRR